MVGTYAQIKTKIRRLTASPSKNQLSDDDINQAVDSFYEIDLPAHLKLWELRGTYTFYTEPGEDNYTFDKSANFNFQPPVYMDGLESQYYQSEAAFYRMFPKQLFESKPTTGNGTVTVSGTITNAPIIKRNLMITAIDINGTQQVGIDYPETTDATKQFRNGNSQSIDLLTGTINYDTGVFSLSFPQIIPSANSVIVRSINYIATRPQAMLYFHNSLTLRPVPDACYRIDVQTYKRPSQLFSSGDYDPTTEPDLTLWWELIAVGAARKILQERQDMEGLQNLNMMFKEQMTIALQRTIKQQTSQRTETIYSGQTGNMPSINSFWGY